MSHTLNHCKGEMWDAESEKGVKKGWNGRMAVDKKGQGV